MSKIFYISDVHGCLDELSDLIQKISPSSNDKIVFIGDLINKGPDSAGVVSYAEELSKFCDVCVIRGNHEEKMLRFHKKFVKGGEGAISSFKKKDDLLRVYKTFSQDNLEFLKNTKLYFRYGPYLAVHAGVPPVIGSLPDLLSYERSSKGHKRFFDQMLRVRFVNQNGMMISLGEETSLDKFWADVYDNRFGYVVYGHQAHYIDNEPKIIGSTIGIDLGCVYGGHLCSMELDSKTFERTFHIVKARQQYSKPREGA